ncbi:MAG TPA: hypothetical protein VIN75_19700 [Burkholderiaceae bacterium]
MDDDAYAQRYLQCLQRLYADAAAHCERLENARLLTRAGGWRTQGADAALAAGYRSLQLLARNCERARQLVNGPTLPDALSTTPDLGERRVRGPRSIG